MYCTGGIRCEKSSAYFQTKVLKMFTNWKVELLIHAKVKEENLESKFIGKNFVFDHRLANY
jgi:UPF0176 protein